MDQSDVNLKNGCRLVLHYFSIFRYPLTAVEIHKFNPVRANAEEIDRALKELAAEGKIFHQDGYYLPGNNLEWIGERRTSNDRAYALLARSGKYVRLIASCPFVRGIAISGSLSKFAASAHPDIDYFIITRADRLWIARSLLHLFKKFTFITGHQHFFCMNYFIDTQALRITHANKYTAIEVATLLPVYNAELIRQFCLENQWVSDYLPNHPGPDHFEYLIKEQRFSLKKIMEGIINLCFPARLNRFFMMLTDKKWRRKWKKAAYPAEDYDKAFMTSLHISKNHPVDYEKKVLAKLAEDEIR
jgi:hypothetical protein